MVGSAAGAGVSGARVGAPRRGGQSRARQRTDVARVLIVLDDILVVGADARGAARSGGREAAQRGEHGGAANYKGEKPKEFLNLNSCRLMVS